MSPPSVWGPPVWTLFHTLIEKINPQYNNIAPQLFYHFVKICKYLPCPECSSDAIKFLANIKPSNYENKTSLKNTFYLFHNYVNKKKRKPLFNYSNINIYQKYKINEVLSRFLTVYNTKGNMQQLTESFQRELIVKDFKKWLSLNIKGFMTYVNIPRVIPEAVIPEAVIPEAVIPEAVIPEAVIPEAVIPEAVIPEAVIPEAVIPETVIPETVIP